MIQQQILTAYQSYDNQAIALWYIINNFLLLSIFLFYNVNQTSNIDEFVNKE